MSCLSSVKTQVMDNISTMRIVSCLAYAKTGALTRNRPWARPPILAWPLAPKGSKNS